MAGAPYKVYIVVDREFGDKPAEIEGAPVWIVDTPINKPWSDACGVSIPSKIT